MVMDTLTAQQRNILAVERQFWRTAEAKEQAIRDMGLTVVRYYQLLNQMLGSQAVLAADPQLVYRLRRIAHRP
jgi:hypothetical protein